MSAPADGSPLRAKDMTILKPHSVDPNGGSLVIHIDAPSSGSYTITENGAPLASDVTAAYQGAVGATTGADTLVVSSTDQAATVRCEIRTAQGDVVATGEATGTLECAYDRALLLE